MKALLAVSAFVATGALGLGLAFSQMLFQASAPVPAPKPVTALVTPPPVVAPAQPAPPQVMAQAQIFAPAPLFAPIPQTATGATATEAPAHRQMAYRSMNVDGPYIAITFDDGPNPETTPKLLKMLEARGIKATFFMLGSKAVQNLDVVKMVAAAGHEIGNHSWNHPQLPKIGEAAVDKQIEDTSAVIQNATGKQPIYLRPPYGAMTPALERHIAQKYGMTMIYWSVDPLDWKNHDGQAIYDKIMSQVRPGGIVLAHDIHATTVAAMPRVLDALIAKGYKFVTVSELIAMDKPAAPKVASLTPPPAPKKKVRPVQHPKTVAAVPVAQPSN